LEFLLILGTEFIMKSLNNSSGMETVLELCRLNKHKRLRYLLYFISLILLVLVLFVENFNILIILLLSILLGVILVILQYKETVEIIGRIIFQEKEMIILKFESEKRILKYSEIKNIKIKARNIKDDVILFKGFPFYLRKKGCNNIIKLYTKSNEKIYFNFMIDNVINYNKIIHLKTFLNNKVGGNG